MEQKFQWVRQLLDVQSDAKSEEEFLQTLRIDLFTDQVFVFSPKGDVLSFPAGSTPIDFAFSIHSAIGYKMQGAKVNDKIVPLEYQLQNGDIVEIITSSAVHGPSMDWLKIIKTSQARNKINAWFKKENREENIVLGKDMLEKELKRQGLGSLELNSPDYIARIVKRYGYASEDDLFANLGYGGLNLANLITKLKDEYKKLNAKAEPIVAVPTGNSTGSSKSKGASNGIIVKGIENCLIRYSQCCSPVPGDKIIGYITRGRGVSIHRQDCINVAAMYKDEDERARLIDVSWENNLVSSYISKLKVVCADRAGLVLEVANVVGETKVNLKTLNARSTKDGLGIVEISVEVSNTDQLNLLIKKLNKLNDLIEVTRNN
jgi:GTP pyrophosphokinase